MREVSHAGFARLIGEGVHYRTADLNYTGTATGPGHATMGTGTYPWKSGIVPNNYHDRATGTRTYSVSDSSAALVEGAGGGELRWRRARGDRQALILL